MTRFWIGFEKCAARELPPGWAVHEGGKSGKVAPIKRAPDLRNTIGLPPAKRTGAKAPRAPMSGKTKAALGATAAVAAGLAVKRHYDKKKKQQAAAEG